MYKRSYHNLNFIRIWPEKPFFFKGWSWFKFNNLGLALATNLKLYSSLSKGLKLKVRKFLGLIPTFVEVTGEKLVGEAFLAPPPSWIGLIKFMKIRLQHRYFHSNVISRGPVLKNACERLLLNGKHWYSTNGILNFTIKIKWVSPFSFNWCFLGVLF